MSVQKRPYEHLLHVLEHDSRAQTEVVSGKRVGFYWLKETLGAGSFYQVKLGVHLLTSESVVVKIINRTKLLPECRPVISQEISSIMKLDHCNIIRLFEVYESFLHLSIFMEYASEGDLHSRVLRDGPFSEQRAKEIFVQVVAGVAYMHCNSVIHRDLRPKHVFYITGSHIKIGGFVFSIQEIKKTPDIFCSSLPYAAPELLEDNCHVSPSVDVWAMGVLLYYILTRNTPFVGDEVAAMKEQILSGHYTQPTMVSPACQDAIAMLLTPNTTVRPSATDMLGSKWLQGEQGVLYPSKPHQLPSQPDSGVLECMRRFGVPKTNASELLGNPHSAMSGIYRILLHQKWTGHAAERLPQPSVPTDATSTINRDFASVSDEYLALENWYTQTDTPRRGLTKTTNTNTHHRVQRLKRYFLYYKNTVCRKIKMYKNTVCRKIKMSICAT